MSNINNQVDLQWCRIKLNLGEKKTFLKNLSSFIFKIFLLRFMKINLDKFTSSIINISIGDGDLGIRKPKINPSATHIFGEGVNCYEILLFSKHRNCRCRIYSLAYKDMS